MSQQSQQQQHRQTNAATQLPASPSRSAVCEPLCCSANADPFAMRAQCGNTACQDGRRQG
ncbi:hypothetical protein GSI_10838 [Ganoderma sinense ZZ0214-1]|uniref:Uncharacterized protein n=1 Tax=Ganoderma sinense ZZ0214-1 TaxID=1077348 RepID=A0A2G8S1P8_9APHY|nr:hypothetical protein GSI_10838 [Ganoderma sinense ZZ0214-1]